MGWIVPFASTDSTIPMWREPQTISSPGAACALVRPVRCAQSQTALTAPKPWPCSPSGIPAWRAAHEAKYAHHGPTPEPAVADRYPAMRGESLEPGGCSVWPTSALAACSMPCAPPPGVGAPSVGEKAVVVIADVAFAPGTAAVWAPSVAWNDDVDAGLAAGGTRDRSISAIRAITLSTLIHREDRT